LCSNNGGCTFSAYPSGYAFFIPKVKTMVKRIVIAGSRHYSNYEEAREYLDLCLKDIKDGSDLIILSGGAQGGDAIGERYAKENGFIIEKHPAEWKKYGKRAGPIRNKAMADMADVIICFWNGESKGTSSLIGLAKRLNKELKIKIIN